MADFSWRPGIGDPTIGGWITVALYFAAFLTSWRAAQSTDGREQKLWLLISLMFIFLGINKQLNLPSALTEACRMLAIQQGWYAERGIVQLWFIAGVALVGLCVAVSLLRLASEAPASTWFALIGTVIVLAFVLIRAASLHDIDRFIDTRILGLKWNWVLEIGGTSIVLVASLSRQRDRPAPSKTPP